MLKIPDNILIQYEAILIKKVPTVSVHSDYKKWLRYFLDFCGKYPVPDSKSERVRLFIEKLREKKQTPAQQKQAAHAVSFYFEVIRAGLEPAPAIVDEPLPTRVNAKTTILSVSEPQQTKYASASWIGDGEVIRTCFQWVGV